MDTNTVSFIIVAVVAVGAGLWYAMRWLDQKTHR
jgi:hypothetical protein